MILLISFFACLLGLQFSFAIDKIFGYSSYLFAAFFFVIAFLLSHKRIVKIHLRFGFYLLLILGLLYLSNDLTKGKFYPGRLEGIGIEVVIPLAIFAIRNSFKISFNVIKFISYSSLLSFAGMCFFYFGIKTQINIDEVTITNGLMHYRGTSFYGVSLTYAAIAFAQLLASAYLYVKEKNSTIYLFLIGISLICIFDSSSRRAMLPALVSIFFAIKTRRIELNTKNISVLIFFVISISFFGGYYYIERIISASDFVGDTGNASRWLILKDVIHLFTINIFGYGPSSFSSIGKAGVNPESFEGYIGESYYLTMLGEYGVAFILFLLLAILSIKRIEKNIRRIILYPIALEAIFGLSLFVPYYVMTICYILAHHKNTK